MCNMRTIVNIHRHDFRNIIVENKSFHEFSMTYHDLVVDYVIIFLRPPFINSGGNEFDEETKNLNTIDAVFHLCRVLVYGIR